MPELDGSDVLTALREEGLHTSVVFLSAFLDSKTVYEAVAAGANAYLSKEADTDEIVAAIRAAARGETILGPEVQTGLAEQIRFREENEARPRLSDREHEVLRLIAAGHVRARDRRADPPEHGHRQDPPPAPLREARRLGAGRRGGRGNAARAARLVRSRD